MFVGPTHNKPKKQFKTKFYKQTPWKLKLMKFEKKKQNLPTKWNWNLKKPLALPHLDKVKKGQYQFEKQDKIRKDIEEQKNKSNRTSRRPRSNKEVP